jgi:hypothetical protein
MMISSSEAGGFATAEPAFGDATPGLFSRPGAGGDAGAFDGVPVFCCLTAFASLLPAEIDFTGTPRGLVISGGVIGCAELPGETGVGRLIAGPAGSER